MRKTLFAATVAAFTLLFGSCLNAPENTYNWSQSVYGTFVSVNAESGLTVYSDKKCIAKISMTDAFTSAIGFEMFDVRISPLEDKISSLALANMPFQVYSGTDKELEGAWIIDIASMVPYVDGALDEEYRLSNIKGVIDDYEWTMDFDVTLSGTTYHISYESNFDDGSNLIDPKWTQTVTGKLDTASPESGDILHTESAASITGKMGAGTKTLDLTLNGVKFLDSMPEAVTVTLKALPFELYNGDDKNLAGAWIVKADNVAATSNGGEYTALGFSNLNATISPKEWTLSFTLTQTGADGDTRYSVSFHYAEAK